jgi:hypothetical protein
MSFLKDFPDRPTLLHLKDIDRLQHPIKVNNHIHSPYSFSAFRNIEEAVRMAREEEIRILGINDFYVTSGYREFIDRCMQNRLFPLLNIELIGISRAEQEAGIRVNDPNNPGRNYISGKGLAFPSILSAALQQSLDKVVKESNNQVARMTGLVNRWLELHHTGISLPVKEIMEEHARDLLRERHVAKALRIKIEKSCKSDDEFYRLLELVYGGKPSERERKDVAGVEEEIRARLLKAGAPAFVPEDEKAFMGLDEIIGIIEQAGGIPTYPMLLDGAGGMMTGFESDRERLLKVLKSRGFRSVEMIPHRNRIEVLKEYAEYFYENGFIVSFGTEHNTSAMLPLTVRCKGEVPLDRSLMQISFNGAACLAAHQYLVAKEGLDYHKGDRDEMEQLGRGVMNYYFSSNKAGEKYNGSEQRDDS